MKRKRQNVGVNNDIECFGSLGFFELLKLLIKSLVLKRQGREADHSPPSSAEVKRGGTMPSLPHVFS
jgi:hypothetical protein